MTKEADHATLMTALTAPGMTVAALAKQLGVTERTVYRWMAGKHRIPRAVIIATAVLKIVEKTDA